MSLRERFKLEDQEMERFSLNKVFFPHKDTPKTLDESKNNESSEIVLDNVETEDKSSVVKN